MEKRKLRTCRTGRWGESGGVRKVWFFNWPSNVGGADTKFLHLIGLLSGHWRITVMAPTEAQLARRDWREWMEARGVRCVPPGEPGDDVAGEWMVSLCNGAFFTGGVAREMRRRGMKLAWSSEMMWHHPKELAWVALGRLDRLFYVSPEQRAVLEPGYLECLGGDPSDACRDPDAMEGWLEGAGGRRVSWCMTGNYIDPAYFPWRDRSGDTGRPLVIGRLSRPDPVKFPPDFPQQWEGFGLRDVRFRVMAWSRELSDRWRDHVFGDRWDLLPQEAETQRDFLHSLDVMVHDVAPGCSESWGRSVVEGMLTGVIPVVPADPRHHLHRLIVHGESGFAFRDYAECREYVRQLAGDAGLRKRMSRNARERAVTVLCNAEEHLRIWERALAD